jgi:hypothetical protein
LAPSLRKRLVIGDTTGTSSASGVGFGEIGDARETLMRRATRKRRKLLKLENF